MKINRLVAGSLALVLIAGFGPSAFAQTTVSVDGEDNVISTSSFETAGHDDVIFDNGGDPVGETGHTMDTFVPAEDFILDNDFVMTDVHFVVIDVTPEDFQTEYEYFIFSDGAGEPGDLIASGDAINLVLGDRSDFTRFVWFDLEEPVELEADTIYWLGLHAISDTSSGIGWVFGSEGFGSQTLQSEGGTFDNWTNFNSVHAWFLITGHPPDAVGGELLPIDNTALMLAGIQSSTIWMLPALAGIAGAGAFFVRTRMNKE